MKPSSKSGCASSETPAPPSTDPTSDLDKDYSAILENTDYHAQPKKRRRLFGDDTDLEYEAISTPTNRELNKMITDFVSEVVERDLTYYKRVRIIPQHLESGEATPECLDARRGRITGSNAIKASVKANTTAQRRRYDSELIHTPKFNPIVKELVTYGSVREKHADAALRYVFDKLAEYKAVDYDYPGLCINTKEPYLAMSPDGIWTLDSAAALIEYKCRAWWCLNCDFKVTDDNVLMMKRKNGVAWEVMKDFFVPTGEDKWMLADKQLFPNGDRWAIPCKYLAQLRHGVYTIDHVEIKKIVFCAWINLTGDFADLGRGRYRTPTGTIQVTTIDAEDLLKGCATQKDRIDHYYTKTYLPNVCLKAGNYHGLYPPQDFF